VRGEEGESEERKHQPFPVDDAWLNEVLQVKDDEPISQLQQGVKIVDAIDVQRVDPHAEGLAEGETDRVG
jgi:hypothetical protein